MNKQLESTEFETQEIMQYAIIMINKMGYVKSNNKLGQSVNSSTKNRVCDLLNNFDFYQARLKHMNNVLITKDEIFSLSNQNLAEKVLQYFANKEINSDAPYVDTDKKLKELALNMYNEKDEIGMICYMYELYCRIKHIGKYEVKMIA